MYYSSYSYSSTTFCSCTRTHDYNCWGEVLIFVLILVLEYIFLYSYSWKNTRLQTSLMYKEVFMPSIMITCNPTRVLSLFDLACCCFFLFVVHSFLKILFYIVQFVCFYGLICNFLPVKLINEMKMKWNYQPLGVDPATDLRACGFLGLMTLLHFVMDPVRLQLAREIYRLSLHETQVELMRHLCSFSTFHLQLPAFLFFVIWIVISVVEKKNTWKWHFSLKTTLISISTLLTWNQDIH